MVLVKYISSVLSFRPLSRNPRDLSGSRIKSGMTWARMLLIGVVFFLLPIITFAAEDNGIVKCGPQQTKLCELKDLFSLLVGIYNFLLGMAGIVAFAFLIYGGLKMFLYSVDEEQLASGKKTVIEALIGLAIIAMAYILVNTLLTVLGYTGAGGVFGGAGIIK